MNEQKRSLLGGGGGIIGSAQSRLHLQANLDPDIVCSGISVRFRTWSDIAATYQTLVGPAVVSFILPS